MKIQNGPIASHIQLPSGYSQLLAELKAKVRSARLRATLAANKELVELYLDIGRIILERQENENWGSGVIKKLAEDLKAAFPDMKVFSPRNMFYMRKAALCSKIRQLCNKLLHNCPGAISRFCLIS